MSDDLFLSTKVTNEQRKAIEGAHDSHHALVKAQAYLEHALGSAQGGREKSWAREVAVHLRKAKEQIAAHRTEVQRPHGLYQEIEFEAPRLSSRIQNLIGELKKIEDETERLAIEIEKVCGGDNKEIGDIRPAAAQMMVALRKLMALETDLVFERFNEPPALD